MFHAAIADDIAVQTESADTWLNIGAGNGASETARKRADRMLISGNN